MTSPAERKIAEAIKNGDFDNLRGMGEPLSLDDLARDENLAHRLLVDKLAKIFELVAPIEIAIE